jgi:cytochrome b involved in lipid metabolism
LDYALKPKVPNANSVLYSYEQVGAHNIEHDCWTVYEGRVYDVTEYLKRHPGGVSKLMLGAGKDCTELFKRYHGWVSCHRILARY